MLRYTESFKGLRLKPDGFYLVMLPLGIRWLLMKYHIISSLLILIDPLKKF